MFSGITGIGATAAPASTTFGSSGAMLASDTAMISAETSAGVAAAAAPAATTGVLGYAAPALGLMGMAGQLFGKGGGTGSMISELVGDQGGYDTGVTDFGATPYQEGLSGSEESGGIPIYLIIGVLVVAGYFLLK